MKRKAKAKPHKKPQQNRQDPPAPREKWYDRPKRGVLTFLNAVIEALARLLTALWEGWALAGAA